MGNGVGSSSDEEVFWLKPTPSPTATPVTMTTAQMIAACLPRIKYRFSFFSNSRLSMASRQTLRVRMCTNTQSSESQNTLPVNPHTHTHTHTRANTHTHSILTLPFASKERNSCVWIPKCVDICTHSSRAACGRHRG